MNKYRIVNYLDEYNEIICLSCKSLLTCSKHPSEEKWKTCPVCQVVWDGEFTKRHKRITIPNQYDWKNHGYKMNYAGEFIYSDKPRLIIEIRTYSDSILDELSFCVKKLPNPKYTQWHLISHTVLEWSNNQNSASVEMWNKFKNRDLSEKEEIRIRWLYKYHNKVLKTRKSL